MRVQERGECQTSRVSMDCKDKDGGWQAAHSVRDRPQDRAASRAARQGHLRAGSLAVGAVPSETEGAGLSLCKSAAGRSRTRSCLAGLECLAHEEHTPNPIKKMSRVTGRGPRAV